VDVLIFARQRPAGAKTLPSAKSESSHSERGRQLRRLGEENRRSNGEQVTQIAGLALKSRPSLDFSGYWQRHLTA